MGEAGESCDDDIFSRCEIEGVPWGTVGHVLVDAGVEIYANGDVSTEQNE